MIALLVALGAAVGAPARYLTDRAVQARHDTRFPWGTLTVNVAASFVLGGIAGAAGHISAEAFALVATGFCGAMSTFSALSYETFHLARDREWFHAVASIAVSLVAALGAVSIGWAIGSSV